MNKDNKPKYNGWVIALLVIGALSSDDWFFIAVLLLAIIYVVSIENLRMKYRISKK